MIQKKKEEINMNKIEKKEIAINNINSNNVIQLNEKERRDILDESKLYIHDENKSKYYPESNNSGENKGPILLNNNEQDESKNTKNDNREKQRESLLVKDESKKQEKDSNTQDQIVNLNPTSNTKQYEINSNIEDNINNIKSKENKMNEENENKDINELKYKQEDNNKTNNNSVVLDFCNASEFGTKQDIKNSYLNSEIEKDSKEVENNILIKSQNEIKSVADNIFLNKKLTNEPNIIEEKNETKNLNSFGMNIIGTLHKQLLDLKNEIIRFKNNEEKREKEIKRLQDIEIKREKEVKRLQDAHEEVKKEIQKLKKILGTIQIRDLAKAFINSFKFLLTIDDIDKINNGDVTKGERILYRIQEKYKDKSNNDKYLILTEIIQKSIAYLDKGNGFAHNIDLENVKDEIEQFKSNIN